MTADQEGTGNDACEKHRGPGGDDLRRELAPRSQRRQRDHCHTREGQVRAAVDGAEGRARDHEADDTSPTARTPP